MRILSGCLIALVAFLCAMLVDCSMAQPDWQPAIVTGKWVKPAWSEFQTTSDGKNSHITTIYHAPEYYISTVVGVKYGDVLVASWDYGRWNSQDRCEVEFRHGRMMNYGFLAIRARENE